MNNYSIIVVFIILVFSNIYSQSVKSYYKSYKDCNQDKDPNCTYVSVDIDKVENASASDIINKAVEDSVIAVLSGYDTLKAATIDEGMTNFINSYAEEASSLDNPISWFMDITGSVENQEKNFISYSVSFGGFTGGAHPFGYTSYFNLDPNTGRRIELKELFKPGYEKKLNKKLDFAFRKQNDFSNDKNLKDEGLFVEKIEANNNFALLKDAILFFYNLYEIAPYVSGPTEIKLSYNKLTDIISDKSVINTVNRSNKK